MLDVISEFACTKESFPVAGVVDGIQLTSGECIRTTLNYQISHNKLAPSRSWRLSVSTLHRRYKKNSALGTESVSGAMLATSLATASTTSDRPLKRPRQEVSCTTENYNFPDLLPTHS